MEHVDVGGTQIAYTRVGSGPPLVMVHGAPADSRTWQWMLPDLARDHTVVAWDAPGFGQSSDIDDTWRAAEFADALAAFIVTLGLERPHLVGHSFGTMVALSLFERHPAVPASLVLIGGYAGWAGSLPAGEVARRLEMFLGMADLGDAFDPKSYPGLFTDLIPGDRDRVLATMMRENIRPSSFEQRVTSGPRPTSARCCLPLMYRPSSCTVRQTLGRRSRTPKRFMRRSRHRSSLCSRSLATRVWWRIPRRVRRRSAGS